MRRFRAINLIALCALVLLLADDGDAFIVNFLKTLVPSFLRNPLKELKTIRQGIVPGTLWCGPGNIASNYEELGNNWRLDTCCRAHDSCRDLMQPGESKYGLRNDARLCRKILCECETQFYNCLKGVPGVIAFSVGELYFSNCQQCLNSFYNVDTCVERNLVVNAGQDLNGNRVFCAQFDVNPEWEHAGPELNLTFGPRAWIDSESGENNPMYDENYDTPIDMDISMIDVY